MNTTFNEILQLVENYTNWFKNEIIKVTDESTFSQDLHSIISAVIDIGNLYLTAQDRVASYFYDDVLEFLDKKKIYYTEDVEFKGKTNFTHTYDLLFQKNQQNPERLCNVIDNPNKGKISNVLFLWEDTKDIRKVKNPDSRLIIILNDEQRLPQNILEALERYDVSPVLWSEREEKYTVLM